MAELEARKLKYANTGTEALLLGILIEGSDQFCASQAFCFLISISIESCICISYLHSNFMYLILVSS